MPTKTKTKTAAAAPEPSISVEPSEVVFGNHVRITGSYPKSKGDTEIVVEAIYPSAAPITYELGPAHNDGELDVSVGTLEAGEVLVRVFSVEYNGEGDQRVAGARTPLGTASFTVVAPE